MIDFPNNPTVGQQFTAAGVTWTWDGFKWAAAGLNVAYLPLAGGTMLGPLTLQANPAGNLDAATKQYVDALSMGYPLGANRIINGDMRIDQRNNGASGTAVGYTIDRWAYLATQTGKGTWQRAGGGVVMLGYGFGYALIFTSSSAYALLAGDQFYFRQIIEADMITDFAWGTSGAQPVTLSFWVNSSLTGTFSGAIQSFPAPPARCYPFTFSIPVASTWTKIIITIPGDTAGTWVMSGNLAGVGLVFDLGSGSTFRALPNAWTNGNFTGANGAVSVVGTNGATFYLTGVKLEIGSIATPFNRQSLAKSMADCQRYFQSFYPFSFAGYAFTGGASMITPIMLAPMRTQPTVTKVGNWNYTNVTAGNVTFNVGPTSGYMAYTPTTGSAFTSAGAASGGSLTFDAEL